MSLDESPPGQAQRESFTAVHSLQGEAERDHILPLGRLWSREDLLTAVLCHLPLHECGAARLTCLAGRDALDRHFGSLPDPTAAEMDNQVDCFFPNVHSASLPNYAKGSTKSLAKHTRLCVTIAFSTPPLAVRAEFRRSVGQLVLRSSGWPIDSGSNPSLSSPPISHLASSGSDGDPNAPAGTAGPAPQQAVTDNVEHFLASAAASTFSNIANLVLLTEPSGATAGMVATIASTFTRLMRVALSVPSKCPRQVGLGILGLAALPNLSDLCLVFCPVSEPEPPLSSMEGVELAELGLLTRLTRLSVMNASFALPFSHLSSMTRLQTLKLGECEGNFLQGVEDLTGLSALHVYASQEHMPSRQNQENLLNLTGLQSLLLTQSRMLELGGITQLTLLTELMLASEILNDNGAESLARLPGLKRLHVTAIHLGSVRPGMLLHGLEVLTLPPRGKADGEVPFAVLAPALHTLQAGVSPTSLWRLLPDSLAALDASVDSLAALSALLSVCVGVSALGIEALPLSPRDVRDLPLTASAAAATTTLLDGFIPPFHARALVGPSSLPLDPMAPPALYALRRLSLMRGWWPVHVLAPQVGAVTSLTLEGLQGTALGRSASERQTAVQGVVALLASMPRLREVELRRSLLSVPLLHALLRHPSVMDVRLEASELALLVSGTSEADARSALQAAVQEAQQSKSLFALCWLPDCWWTEEHWMEDSVGRWFEALPEPVFMVP